MAIDTQPVEPLSIEVPADADRLGDVRRQLVAWLEPMDLPEAVAADIVLVVNEACTNCVEHAYRGGRTGIIEIEALVEDSKIVVCVADFGHWRKPPTKPNNRGRGLPIMHAVSDGVELDTTSTGTTVRLVFDAMEASRAV